MTPQPNWKFPRPVRNAGLIAVTITALFTLLAASETAAQVAPKATGKPKPTVGSRVRRQTRIPRPTNPVGTTSPGVTESDRFLELGDRFQEKERWNAAESAYKEAVKLWPRNAEALTELGYIYLNSNRIPEAQATASKLQGVNPQYARELQSDIAKQRAKR